MRSESEPTLIWDRPEPDERRAATTLNRAMITAAALRIADAHGLDAVSIRSVAAAVDVRPMRLYSYVRSKEEMLELLVDAVFAEVRPRRGGDWTVQVRAIARATRAALLRHGWVVELLGGRPNIGPARLAVLEATAAALARAPGLDDVDRLQTALGVVNAYVFGAVAVEVGGRRASASDDAAWRAVVAPYLRRAFDTGQLPMMRRVVQDGRDAHPDTVFRRELDIVLRGIAAT